MVAYRTTLVAGAGLSMMLLSAGAAAQAPQGPASPPPPRETAQLEEIIVTAQRRAETVQDVPVAVTAFSAAELERRQVNETLDLVNFVPNLIGSNNTGLGSANQYYLRALGNTETIATFDPPVGSYVDDIYISRQNANNFAFFDVERIEVLRGPQGTLFGRNTTGGAVNVILAKPRESFGGFAELGYGKDQEFLARASVDVPLGTRVLSKVSAFRIENDGWADNITTGEDNNDEETLGLRGALRFLLSDKVAWDVSADYVDSDNTSLMTTTVDGKRVTRTGLRREGGALRPFFSGEKGGYGLGNTVSNWTLTSNLEVEADFATISVISGYRDLRQEYALDFANLPVPTGGFIIANTSDHEQFSQEVKLNGSLWADRVEYVAGIYYLYEDNVTDFGDLLAFGAPTVLADRVLDNTTEAKAAYAQVDVKVTPQLTATAGIRFTEEQKEIAFQPNVNARAVNRWTTADIVALGIPTEQTAAIWTPRFALEYAPTDDIMVFVSATRGFKSGGWNARGTSAQVTQPFGPEKVWSYEAGARTELLDGTLRANLNAFYSDVSDFQIPSAFQSPNGAITFLTGNYADMTVLGLEAELLWLPLPDLTLSAAFGWQNAYYKNPAASVLQQQAQCLAGIAARCGQGIVTPAGGIAEPVRAPDVTLTVSASYDIRLNGYLLTPNASVTRVADHYVQTSNVVASFENGYTVLNAGVIFEPEDGTWSLSAECNNCTDEEYVTSFLINRYFNRPVSWMVKGRVRF